MSKPKKKTLTLGEHLEKATKAKKPAKAPKPPTKRETLQAECDRLRREIKAYKAHESRAKRLADEVEACRAEVEAAKAETAARKTNLATANEALARFIRGGAPRDVETGKQQTMIDTPPAGTVAPLIDPRADGATAFAAGKDLSANPYSDESMADSSRWVSGYQSAKWTGLEERKSITYAITGSALMEAWSHEPIEPGAKDPQVKALRFLDYHWLVVDGWKGDGGQLRFTCIQLLKKDDWKDTWAPTYGKACPGFDANDEAKARRQNGGVDCGRIVRVGREQFVVGPRSSGCILVAPVQEMEPKPVEGQEPEQLSVPFDAKAAAANDSTNDEAEDD